MKAYSKRIIALTLAFIMVLAIPFSTFAEKNDPALSGNQASEVKTEEPKNSEEGKEPEASATDQGEVTEAETQSQDEAAQTEDQGAIGQDQEVQGIQVGQQVPQGGPAMAPPPPSTEAQNFTPATKTLEVVKGGAVDITTGLTNAPAGATVAVKTNVDTSTVGSQTGVITVTFSDTSTKDVNITVNVKAPASEADSFTPATKTLEVVKGGAVDITTGLTNAPAGATVTVKTGVDTSTVGSQIGVITVTFSDNSTKDVNIIVNVKESTPILKKLVISSESVNSSGIVSGYVKADGLAVKGATVTFYTNGGTAVASGTTDVNGYFSFYVGTEYYGYYDGYYGWYDYDWYDGYYGYYDGYYDGYYNGHKVYYNSTDGYYYYNDANHKVYLNNYYWNGHKHGRCGNSGYLLASLTDYETSEKAYVTGTCSGDYYYYPSYKYEYNYSDYRVYPSNMTRTSSSVRGYLPNEKGKTVYVYSSDDWYGYDGYYGYNYRYGNSYLGSATVGSDGYFTIYFNRSVSSSENLYFYVNGYRGNYATVPTMTVATPGTKLVQGKAGAYAGILIKDANGYELGKTVADKDGNYTCYINRELVAGESLTVVASETNKYDSQATYKVVGDSLTGDTFSRVSYIKGYPDGSFKPQNNVTRAEAAQMFATLLNNGTSFGTSSITKFSDANNGWYSAAINYVVGKDLIAGYADGTFKPNQNITRAEFAQMISGYIKAGFAGSSNFKDVKGHWASDAIDKVYGNKSVAGYPDGSFKPNQNITRAEAVTILNSVFNRYTTSESLKNVSTGSLKTFTDVSSSFWGYYQILDASNYHTSQKLNATTDEEVWK